MSKSVVVTVFPKNMMREISSGSNQRKLISQMTSLMKPSVEGAQREMIASFEGHPVTVEIDQGANAFNVSGTLGGVGNLFSFIGFESGDNPTQIVKSILRKKIKFKIKKGAKVGSFVMQVDAPDKDSILAQTPIPWLMGRSWVDGIEKGISGLGFYLFNGSGVNASRSNTAIQTSKKIRGGRMSNTKYLSEILKNFEKTIVKR